MVSVVARLQAMWATRERGATAVEYGLMVALIAVVIIGTVSAFGKQLSDVFQSVTDKLKPASSTG